MGALAMFNGAGCGAMYSGAMRGAYAPKRKAPQAGRKRGNGKRKAPRGAGRFGLR